MDYIKRDGNQLHGSDGGNGYDMGYKIEYNGKSYYDEGDGARWYCPDDHKTYYVDGDNIRCLDDRMQAKIDGDHIFINNSGKQYSKSEKDELYKNIASIGIIDSIKKHWSWLWFVAFIICNAIFDASGVEAPLIWGFISSIVVYFIFKIIKDIILKKLSIKGFVPLLICLLAIGYWCMGNVAINDEYKIISQLGTTQFDEIQKKARLKNADKYKKQQPIPLVIAGISAIAFVYCNKKH